MPPASGWMTARCDAPARATGALCNVSPRRRGMAIDDQRLPGPSPRHGHPGFAKAVPDAGSGMVGAPLGSAAPHFPLVGRESQRWP